MLQKLQEMVEELNCTNSTNNKIEILKKYPENKELLKYAYNPYFKFHISSDALKKRRDLYTLTSRTNLIEILVLLVSNKLSGHLAINELNGFIRNNKQYEELIYNIIDKNLKVRIDSKVINKVFVGLIPEFKCALARSKKYQRGEVNFTKDVWYAGKKLDGCRLLSIYQAGEVVCYSRSGLEYHNFDVLKTEIKAVAKKLNLDNFVLDGEACIVSDNGKENFKAIVSDIRKKDFTIQNPKYLLFDFLTVDEFFENVESKNLEQRFEQLKIWNNQSKYIEVIKQTKIDKEETLDILTQEAMNERWEGLIIRKSISYEGKRGNNMLKVKFFIDDEYVVKDIKTGPWRIIDKDTGLEKTIETLAAIIIEHKGNPVSVGTGFDLDERKKYYEHPELIIGKTITVQYKEESEDKNGKKSLQIPSVKFIYEEKEGRTV